MPIPKPIKDEKEDDFMQRCMSNEVMQEYEQDQRAAICHNQWRDRNKKEGEIDSASVKRMAEDNTLVIDSADPIKAIEIKDGKAIVGAYAVRFATADERDLQGEYFTPETYFGSRKGDGADVLFNHGYPPTKAFSEVCDRILGVAKTTLDNVGLFVQSVLDLADEYEAAIAKLVAAGKLKWSSGATTHMVKRSQDGQILRWPIAEFSYTPTPAEPRLPAIAPLKSVALDEGQIAAISAAFDEAIKAVWTTSYINDLPDSAFLYIEPGGKKDGEGKTVPRSLRHFPYKDSSGAIDLPHLRNALARIPQSSLPKEVQDKASARAQAILEKQKPSKQDTTPMDDDEPMPKPARVDKPVVTKAKPIMEDPEIQKRIEDEVNSRIEKFKTNFKSEREKIDEAVEAKRLEIQEIYAIGDKFGKRDEAAKFVEDGKSVLDFSSYILSRLNPKTFVPDLPGPDSKSMRRKDFERLTPGEKHLFLKSGGKLTE
jgi:hypothetical protein